MKIECRIGRDEAKCKKVIKLYDQQLKLRNDFKQREQSAREMSYEERCKWVHQWQTKYEELKYFWRDAKQTTPR